MRALVVEDEEAIARLNRRLLELDGFVIEIATTAADGARLALANDYDVIVLDLVLPDGNGLTVLEGIRRRGETTPVLVLTGTRTNFSIVKLLDAGADDYLMKPYRIEELRARVRALVRRSRSGDAKPIECGNIALDRVKRNAMVNGQRLSLTVKEFALLECFMMNRGKVLPRSELLKKVWRSHFDPGTNVVDVNVARLRAKLAGLGATGHVDAKRGIGYFFSEA